MNQTTPSHSAEAEGWQQPKRGHEHKLVQSACLVNYGNEQCLPVNKGTTSLASAFPIVSPLYYIPATWLSFCIFNMPGFILKLCTD